MHDLLARQLRSLDLDPDSVPQGPGAWQRLLDKVASSYDAADQSRYLLERSLAVSSEEMRQLHVRQAALTTCSQALLYNRDDQAIDQTLNTLVDALDLRCALLDENADGEAGQNRLRRGTACSKACTTSEQCAKPVVFDDTVATLLRGAETVVAPADGGSAVMIPIHTRDAWAATLLVNTGDKTLDRADVATLRVAAEMVGVFLDQEASRAELLALSRSKDQLITTVGHEIRSPMAVVMGLAEELHQGFDTFGREELIELTALIVDHSADVSNIVEDLLVASRHSIGALHIVPVEIKPLHEAQSMTTRARGELPQDVIVTGTPCVAWADVTRFRQVLRNLLTNAGRYGGPRVEVEVSQEGATVSVQVRDDGAGIPDALREQVFEPFVRADNAGRQTNSVGIGLTVSRQLARLMGGDLRYRRDHPWSVFTLEVPTAE